MLMVSIGFILIYKNSEIPKMINDISLLGQNLANNQK